MRKTLLLLLALACAPVLAADYVQQPGSTLAFAGKYQGEVFTGRFPAFTTRLAFDPARLDAARLDVTIPLAGATTGNADYDGELKGSAFFDYAKFPKARFVSTAVREEGGKLVADGNLTIRDKTKPVQLKLDFKPAGSGATLDVQAALKRLDFDVGTGEWTDTSLISGDIAVTSHLVLK